MKGKILKSLPYFILLALSVITLALQNEKVGFEPGHHGWVTSHSLAIISHADLDSYLVGFTSQYKDEQVMKYYRLFHQYPIFFSAAFNHILKASNLTLSGRVLLARQIMNLIFLSTLLLAYLLMTKLIQDRYLSLSTVLFVFSGYYYMQYKDMVNFDQPALLGITFLFLAITVYKLDGKRWLVFLAAVVSVGLGRGYASYSVMLAWFLLESLLILQSCAFDLSKSIDKIIRHDSLRVLVASVALGVLFLGYNIYIESQLTGVPLPETSIVMSASERIGLIKDFNERHSWALGWATFSRNQVARLFLLLMPYSLKQNLPSGVQASMGLQILLFALFAVMISYLFFFIRKIKRDTALIFVLMVPSGFFWLFPMRNLAAFHDYTTIYYAGFSLVFFASILTLVPNRLIGAVLVLAIVVFIDSNIRVNRHHAKIAETVNFYTYDMERIVPLLGTNKNIFIDGGSRTLIPGASHSMGFYLSRHYLSPLRISQYVISKNEKYSQNQLTPENRKLFLFKNDPAPQSTLPPPQKNPGFH